MADVVKIGSEIFVNTVVDTETDHRSSREPQITVLSNGGFVVTWGDANIGDVKAQIFALDGAKVGSEILVNATSSNPRYDPRIIALSNGGFVVTWTDFDSQGSFASDVKAQVFASDGTKIGSEILVNTATALAQFDPQITPLSNGGFVVTWRDLSQSVGGATGDTSDSAVKAQVFAPDGTKIGSEILVNTATASSQIVRQITTLQNGGFVVTWQDESQGVGGATGDTSGSAVKAQAFAADGTRIGSEILVNTATTYEQILPQIGALPDGGFVIT
jgi:hypothetical protein